MKQKENGGPVCVCVCVAFDEISHHHATTGTAAAREERGKKLFCAYLSDALLPLLLFLSYFLPLKIREKINFKDDVTNLRAWSWMTAAVAAAKCHRERRREGLRFLRSFYFVHFQNDLFILVIRVRVPMQICACLLKVIR